MSNKAALETTRTPAIPVLRDGEDIFYVEVARQNDGKSSNNKLGEAAITSILRCPQGGELEVPLTTLESFIASAKRRGVQSSVDLKDPELDLGKPQVKGIVSDPHLKDYLDRLAVQQPLDITRLLPQGGSGSNVGNAHPELPSLEVPKEWSQEPGNVNAHPELPSLEVPKEWSWEPGNGESKVVDVWPFGWALNNIRHNPQRQPEFITEAQRLLDEGTDGTRPVDLHVAALYLGALGGEDTYELWQKLSDTLQPLNSGYDQKYLEYVLIGVKDQLNIAAREQGDSQKLTGISKDLSRGIEAAAGMVSEKVRSVLNACFIGHLTRHCDRLLGAEATVVNMQQALYGQLSRW